MSWELIRRDGQIEHQWQCHRTKTVSTIVKKNGRFHWSIWRGIDQIARHKKPPVMANTARRQVLKYLASLPDFP